MGIDPELYDNILKKDKTKEKIEELKKTFGRRKVILGVDLLEEKKGIPHKFLAFNKFLSMHKDEWAENCVFLQICTTNKIHQADGEVYETQNKDLLSQIHAMGGEIASKYGTFGSVPVHFLDQAYTAEELIPIY